MERSTIIFNGYINELSIAMFQFAHCELTGGQRSPYLAVVFSSAFPSKRGPKNARGRRAGALMWVTGTVHPPRVAEKKTILVGGLFSPLVGMMIQSDFHIFQRVRYTTN